MRIIKSWTTGRGDDPGDVTMAVDVEQMTGVVNGCLWFGVTDGKPEFLPRYNPLPEPVDDDAILPFWTGKQSIKIVDFSDHAPWSPNFDIQHLCGYNWTKTNARKMGAKLKSWGFFEMRSQRDKAGRYFSVWRLLGYWAAKGELRDHIQLVVDRLPTDDEKVRSVVGWLCKHASFGTLDVSTQRAAMSMD